MGRVFFAITTCYDNIRISKILFLLDEETFPFLVIITTKGMTGGQVSFDVFYGHGLFLIITDTIAFLGFAV